MQNLSTGPVVHMTTFYKIVTSFQIELFKYFFKIVLVLANALEFARILGSFSMKVCNLLRWAGEPICFACSCYVVATLLGQYVKVKDLFI